ncbi:MAG: ATP-binding cassette domain-containing protein [Synergistaceae bacterium]|jgi:oligopeptide/dipeptide ABC transporter ATP-binding protein|nr:ATP-binding cassette domain-containing protein [Synergistaceae bacterium]
MSEMPLLSVEGLKKYYTVNTFWGRKRLIKAVDAVSFQVRTGRTLGLVGESGCGKSTVGKTLLRLERANSGKVVFDGQDISNLEGKSLRSLRKNMQMIFQDPYSSLNARMKVRDILAEPYLIHGLAGGAELHGHVSRLLDMVGFSPETGNKYPHEFSGGQRQRIVIARAISLNPKFVVCDEPVSSLDVSVQSQIINLFKRLQKELGLAYLFISHDLSVVRHVSDEVGVMYFGKMAELGNVKDIYEQPLHPYTQALLSSIPIPNPIAQRSREQIFLMADLPSPFNPPDGCRFHTRCKFCSPSCLSLDPEWREVRKGHWVACHLY